MAINKDERRFLRYWEEQRKGSRSGYYIMYILIWFFTAMLCLYFLLNNFVNVRKNSQGTLYLMLGLSALISISYTHFTFLKNERKFRKIIAREMEQGTD